MYSHVILINENVKSVNIFPFKAFGFQKDVIQIHNKLFYFGNQDNYA